MKRKLKISLTAQTISLAEPADLTIVIDVLRATSVMVTALASGFRKIIPVASIEEAQKIKANHPGYLLAGERDAQKIEGFDCGNSPLEFLDDQQAHSAVILTTTNGTLALNEVATTGSIQIASFLNLSAVAQEINVAEGSVLIACAGTKAAFSLDDFLCAGGLISKLDAQFVLDDLGVLARNTYEKTKGDLHGLLAACSHYQILESRGFGPDLDFCIREDIYPILAVVGRSKNGKLFISQKE